MQWRVQHLTLWGHGLCQRGEGCLTKIIEQVKIKVIFLACFGHISIKIMLKINREKEREKSVLRPPRSASAMCESFGTDIFACC